MSKDWLGEIPRWLSEKIGGPRAYWTPCIDMASLPDDHPMKQARREGRVIYYDPPEEPNP